MAHPADAESGRAAAEAQDWERALDLLSGFDPGVLSDEELESLADAAWWCGDIDASIAARQRAYARHGQAGAPLRAARAAWHLFDAYWMRGHGAVADGWLRSARRWLDGLPQCAEHGYVTLAESQLALEAGEVEAAVRLALRTQEVGRACGDRDLAVMGLVFEGKARMAADQLPDGLAMFDEAMTSVITSELSALFTGWVYCMVISACVDAADLGRAGEWADAAMRWCESLPAEAPFQGLCRIKQVEVLSLRGALAQAETQCRTACEQTLASAPGLAGEAFQVAGEIARRRGDRTAAEEAFVRAHSLGAEPYHGLALLRLAEGKVAAAATLLERALDEPGRDRLARARLLAALAEVALAAGDAGMARSASGALDDLARASPTSALQAAAATASGIAVLLEGPRSDGAAGLRRAAGRWRRLGMPYEEARARLLAARALREDGDAEAARLEASAAQSAFERLGAEADAREAARLLTPAQGLPGGLTGREAEVLGLVADGLTNRQISQALTISEHTVARHLNNIFAKLGVSSRAAATAFAYQNELA